MTIEIPIHVFDHLCSIIRVSLINNIPEQLIYQKVANLMANPNSQPRFPTFSSASIAQTCITHARCDLLYMMKDRGNINTTCVIFNIYLTATSVYYKPVGLETSNWIYKKQ